MSVSGCTVEDRGFDVLVDSAAVWEVVETVVLRITPSDVDHTVDDISSSAAETDKASTSRFLILCGLSKLLYVMVSTGTFHVGL